MHSAKGDNHLGWGQEDRIEGWTTGAEGSEQLFNECRPAEEACLASAYFVFQL